VRAYARAPALLAGAPSELVRADARGPALLACTPSALVLAYARAPALLALASLALVRTDALPPALPASAPDALVRAEACPPALLASVPDALVRAEARPPALLACALLALVRADARAPALLASAPCSCRRPGFLDNECVWCVSRKFLFWVKSKTLVFNISADMCGRSVDSGISENCISELYTLKGSYFAGVMTIKEHIETHIFRYHVRQSFPKKQKNLLNTFLLFFSQPNPLDFSSPLKVFARCGFQIVDLCAETEPEQSSPAVGWCTEYWCGSTSRTWKGENNTFSVGQICEILSQEI